ncbi:hypothetical protein NAC44_00005, partial [Allorhizobium sp. BGMRC 0089]|uniref:hypothetical protein n=1 Tax=Allorhizobium sonneratiae TaxID=2934936 RepID=UPI0020343416
HNLKAAGSNPAPATNISQQNSLLRTKRKAMSQLDSRPYIPHHHQTPAMAADRATVHSSIFNA